MHYLFENYTLTNALFKNVPKALRLTGTSLQQSLCNVYSKMSTIYTAIKFSKQEY